MRGYAVIAILTFAPGLFPAGNKLTWEDRVELTRGLTAEYATVKALLPRSPKPLVFDASGGYDKNQWAEVARQSGPAARNGLTLTSLRIISTMSSVGIRFFLSGYRL